jgi:hypothetical protein
MLNGPCLQMLGCGQWLLIVNTIMILVFSLTFYRTSADLLVSILFHSDLFIFNYLFIYSLSLLWWWIYLVSRGCQTFAYMTILTAISVVKLLKHVFMPEHLILVCFFCMFTLSSINLCCFVCEIWRYEMKFWAGKMALWKHNVYGLAPSVASAHHLLVLLDILMS